MAARVSSKDIWPCPYCGADAELSVNRSLGYANVAYVAAYVKCPNCWARGPQITDAGEREDDIAESAVRQWNRL